MRIKIQELTAWIVCHGHGHMLQTGVTNAGHTDSIDRMISERSGPGECPRSETVIVDCGCRYSQ